MENLEGALVKPHRTFRPYGVRTELVPAEARLLLSVQTELD